MDRREQYRPLTERTMDNFQIQHLARKFDFGRESRIARLLVAMVNEAMAEEEEKIGMERVLPFELFVRKNWKKVRLPLFQPAYLEPLYRGESFTASRRLVIRECLRRLREKVPQADETDLLRIIDPWALVKKGHYQEALQSEPATHEERDSAYWQREIDRIRPKTPSQRMEIPDRKAPRSRVRKLVSRVVAETRLGHAVARQLVEEIIVLRNLCCPRMGTLKNGQMPLVVTHVRAHLAEETATRFRRQAPVVITVWTREERERVSRQAAVYLKSLQRRIVRVCFEAYRQNGLLTLMELQWIFQLSSARISELIRSFQNEHHIIVPTPGTVLDAGRSLTHKDIIVRLHLEGYNVNEIARKTYHSPRAVDNYIGTFESVLILKLFGVGAHLMARLLKKGVTLVNEYLELIDEFYADEREIKNYLIARGVKL